MEALPWLRLNHKSSQGTCVQALLNSFGIERKEKDTKCEKCKREGVRCITKIESAAEEFKVYRSSGDLRIRPLIVVDDTVYA